MDAVHAVVGIDVSKKKLDVALLVNGKTKSKVVDNSASGHRELLEWLGKSKAPMAELHVCMEATGVYYEPVALALHAAGLRGVVNPACIKGFGYSENIRNKNDAVDAGLIARYCVAMAPAPWTPPPIEQRQLRAWSMRVQALKDIRQQEENRLEAHTVTGMDEVAEHVGGPHRLAERRDREAGGRDRRPYRPPPRPQARRRPHRQHPRCRHDHGGGYRPPGRHSALREREGVRGVSLRDDRAAPREPRCGGGP